jgi:hypothetical protein
MSFGMFILAVESCDLTQADKSIIRVSSFFNFTKLQFLNDKIYSYTQKNYLALGNLAKIDVLVNFIIQKFARLNRKHFSQFFW